MIKEADLTSALPARDEAPEKKRDALKLVASRAADTSQHSATPADEAVEAPRIIYPAFSVRDERFAALHQRVIFSRLRRRGSYVFYC
jgi:hypothetical protein